MIDARSVAQPVSPPNGLEEDREPTDAELLFQLNERNDQAAFETLVRRHSPMVLGVCKRVLRDDHEAEDALQTTFIILLRKAKSIARPELLANWLYGVAYRVARKARIKANRQCASENLAEMAASPDPHAEPEWLEAKTVLDEELRQLPAKYRIPLVLCYLDGKTNIEAARLVDCPDGSIADRLARARAELRKRLLRRGMVLSAGVIALLLKQGQTSAGVCEQLIGKILEGASGLAGPAAQGSGSIPNETAGSGDAAIEPATGDAVSENLASRPDDDAPSGRKRRRPRKVLRGLLWMTLAIWIVIPVYELVGSDFVQRVGRPLLMNRAARSALRFGVAVSLDAVGRGEAPVRETGGNGPESQSDSSVSAEDEERCKRCLGTSCGTDDEAADSVKVGKSLWNWLFSRN